MRLINDERTRVEAAGRTEGPGRGNDERTRVEAAGRTEGPGRGKPNRLRARPGFSILEMLVVVILVGIVMSVAGVRVSSMMTQQRVIRAASTIQSQMETAFALAGRNREPMKITFATSASEITVKTTNRAGTTAFATTDLKKLGLSNGHVTASSTEITVFPNGFASDTLSIQVSVTQNGVLYKRVVRMSRAGLVKVI